MAGGSRQRPHQYLTPFPVPHPLTSVRIASRVLLRPDFAEGVRAVIVDKTHDPKWNPALPDDVSEDLLDDIFAPLPVDEEWTPLNGVDA